MPMPRAEAPQPNLLDRAIAYVDPARAAKRMAARGIMAVAGGYTGARRDLASLSSWSPLGGSANSDIIPDLPALRARSRDQGRNAPIVVGANNTAIRGIVGTGLSCTPAINAAVLGMGEEIAAQWCVNTRARFEVWAESQDVALNRRGNFYAQQRLAKRSWFENGDVGVLTPLVKREDGLPRLALQLIEADRICNPDRKPDTDILVDGVELDPATNAAIAVHVARRHPGDRLGGQQSWQRVPLRASNGRRNLLHLMDPLRIDQVRGVPWIAPILEPLKQLSRYTDAELKAAVDSALFTFFAKMDPEAFQDVFATDEQAELVRRADQDRTRPLESGRVTNLLPGEEIIDHTPGRPNPQFDPFVQGILTQIGMALEIPKEVLMMHFQSSYTAARGALLMAWQFFRAQRDGLATQLCQPVYELWLEHEVSQGRIAAPGFHADPFIRAAWCRALWTGDGPGSVDPVKDVTAAKGRVDLGISTRDAESILHDGIGWEAKQGQLAREAARMRADGTLPAALQQAGTQPAVPGRPAFPEPGDE
jgi:lambda family phage portal protein